MKRHRFDPVSLIFGALFAGLGGALVSGKATFADIAHGSWVFPVALIVVGVTVVGSAIRPSREHGRSDDAEQADR